MVQEIKPFIKWTGGKGRVLTQILPKFTNLYNDLYVEPFLGGGAVLFKLQPKNAVVADINANLIITYKIVQNSIDKLIKLLKKWQDEYPAKTPKPKDKNGKRQKDENNKNILTEREKYFYKKRDRYNEIKFYENDIGTGESSDKNIEIAALFIFLNKTAFNGMYRENQGGKKKGRYNVPIGDYKNPSIVNEDLLKNVSKYLNENNIEILCNTYQNILEDVNNRFTDKSKKVLIYLDPPYYPTDTSKFTTYTSNKFAVEEQNELSEIFKKQKYTTFLSNSDCTEIRELYGDYIIFDISVMRSISAKASSRGTINEVLIKNELINDEETEEEEKEEIKIENNESDQNTKITDMRKCKGKYKSNGKNCKNPAKENGFCGVHKNQAEKENESVKTQEETQEETQELSPEELMDKIEKYFKEHLDTKLDNIFEEPLLIDWVSNGHYFTKMIELSRKTVKSKNPFASRCKTLELKLASHISAKYLDLEIKTKKQWTTLFGETLVKYCIEIIDEEKAYHCKFIDKDKKTLRPDWETSKNIYEVKTRNYYTPGTAGEKILGVPIKYSDAKEITGKNVKIVIVAYQEWEAINEFHIFKTKSNNRTSILDFYKERLGITYVKFSDLFENAKKLQF